MSGFSEVNELAELIKDNLHSKHLILSAEELLVDVLQDNSSLDRILELQPMSPYHRLLVHRLADIYGFAHESVGEGDDRHLVLMRCTDATVPPIRISDILWQQDDYQSPSTYNHILRKKDSQETSQMSPSTPILCTSSLTTPLKEREAAYQAARERIFSVNNNDDKEVIVPRSRRVPTVARRMIAHALGQNICSATTVEKLSSDEHGDEKSSADTSISPMKIMLSPNDLADATLSSDKGKGYRKHSVGHTAPVADKGGLHKASTAASSDHNSKSGNRKVVDCETLEKQRNIAARRIFSHALGLHSGKGNNDPASKLKQGNR